MGFRQRHPSIAVTVTPFADLHPSAKVVMVDFFQTQKSTRYRHRICAIFGKYIKCMLVVISQEQIYWPYWLLALTRHALRSKSDERIFSNLSLNIIVNFMDWNLTHSSEIIKTLILTRCLHLVQISWRLTSLLQNHWRKSVGHCVCLSACLCMHK